MIRSLCLAAMRGAGWFPPRAKNMFTKAGIGK